MTGTLHKYKRVFIIISYSVLLRKTNVSAIFEDKLKTHTHTLGPKIFF